MSRTHTITLDGVSLIPDLSGALYAPDYGTLLVADVHLEKGSSLARRGIHLPPYDTRSSLAQLAAVVTEIKPERLIFLGDSFHDQEARERIDQSDLAELKRIANLQETLWITGNHDPAPPADIGGSIAAMAALGPITLRHEPSSLGDGEFEIAGHLHPGATVHQRGRGIRCRCFVGDARRIVMPAFGSYTGALGVSAEPFQRIFENFDVWMLGGRAVHRLPGKAVR